VLDGHLETDMHSASSGVDAINRHEVFGVSSVGIFPILLQYLVPFSSTLVLELQLWYLHKPMSVKYVGDVHSSVPYSLFFLSHEDAAPVSQTN
jgi:hypothetical protein